MPPAFASQDLHSRSGKSHASTQELGGGSVIAGSCPTEPALTETATEAELLGKDVPLSSTAADLANDLPPEPAQLSFWKGLMRFIVSA